MRAVVVALGKIGLPIAAQLAGAGHEVVGCDIDPRVIELVNAGRAPFPGEAGLEELLAEHVGAGRLRATADTRGAVAEGPDLVIAVPPLVVDAAARPDWTVLDAVVADIGAELRADGPLADRLLAERLPRSRAASRDREQRRKGARRARSRRGRAPLGRRGSADPSGKGALHGRALRRAPVRDEGRRSPAPVPRHPATARGTPRRPPGPSAGS